jgi:acylphosphatase
LIEFSLCGANATPVIRVSEQKQGRRFYVSGRVQGVGYRFFACDAAQRHGVSGYARNLRDGRVEIYAMGTETQLRALLADLQRGPRFAWVETVSQTEAELLSQFAACFSIEHE